MFVEIATKIQSAEGLVPQTFHVRPESINYLFRPPLQTTTIVATEGGPMPCQTAFATLAERLPGFVQLATPEGVVALVNPERVRCYTMQTLGTLLLMFSSGAKLVVKETQADLERKLGGSNLIV